MVELGSEHRGVRGGVKQQVPRTTFERLTDVDIVSPGTYEISPTPDTMEGQQGGMSAAPPAGAPPVAGTGLAGTPGNGGGMAQMLQMASKILPPGGVAGGGSPMQTMMAAMSAISSQPKPPPPQPAVAAPAAPAPEPRVVAPPAACGCMATAAALQACESPFEPESTPSFFFIGLFFGGGREGFGLQQFCCTAGSNCHCCRCFGIEVGFLLICHTNRICHR